MVELTLEDAVLIKTLLKQATGEESERLSPAMVRHYIHGSKILARLNQASFMVEGFELGDLPKLGQKTREEAIFKSV